MASSQLQCLQNHYILRIINWQGRGTFSLRPLVKLAINLNFRLEGTGSKQLEQPGLAFGRWQSLSFVCVSVVKSHPTPL